MKFPTLENCELCGNSSRLLQSHIIPAFVYRYVMPEAGLFYSAVRPKQPLQGGERVQLLCASCEARLSLIERKFQQLFFPSGKIGSLPLIYDSKLYQFFCSVSWRVLTYLKMSEADKYIKKTKIAEMLHCQIPGEHHELCEESRSRWAESIFSNTSASDDQHVVFLNGNLVPFERSDLIGFCIYQDGKNIATVTLFGPIILLGFIRKGSGWINTSIDPEGSTLPVVAQSIPVEFCRWLHDIYFNLERVAH